MWSGSTELDHRNLNKRLGPAPPLYVLSRPRPAPAMGPAVHALHGPSCEPKIPRTTSTSGSRAGSLHKILSRPPGLHCHDPAGPSAARTLPRASDSDWPGSGQHHQPGRTALRPTCWSRSSANHGPATARLRRALALHGPSRGPVTQTGPEPTTPPGRTSRARADSTNPVNMRYPGKAVSDSIHHPRSSADPRPATARPGGTRAARTLPRAGAPD